MSHSTSDRILNQLLAAIPTAIECALVSGLAAVCWITIASASEKQTHQQLVEKYLIGNTGHFVIDGRNVFFYYRNPKAIEMWVQETNFSDKGILTYPSDDRFCGSWDKQRRGEIRCSQFKSVNETEYTTTTVETGSEFTGKIIKGNPKGF